MGECSLGRGVHWDGVGCDGMGWDKLGFISAQAMAHTTHHPKNCSGAHSCSRRPWIIMRSPAVTQPPLNQESVQMKSCELTHDTSVDKDGRRCTCLAKPRLNSGRSNTVHMPCQLTSQCAHFDKPRMTQDAEMKYTLHLHSRVDSSDEDGG
jgi:hypothetical protein